MHSIPGGDVREWAWGDARLSIIIGASRLPAFAGNSRIKEKAVHYTKNQK
jgi:hypothetical protein